MPDRCATCAFRPGTKASACERTRLVRLCLTAGAPFDCHEATAGTLCEGFREAFESRKTEPAWRRQVAQELLDFLDEAETALWEEDHAMAELRTRVLSRLGVAHA